MFHVEVSATAGPRIVAAALEVLAASYAEHDIDRAVLDWSDTEAGWVLTVWAPGPQGTTSTYGLRDAHHHTRNTRMAETNTERLARIHTEQDATDALADAVQARISA